jgi:hypothetical protein
MVQRPARALVTRRLVEHQSGKFGVGPIDTIDGENQAGGIDVGEGIWSQIVH